MLELNKVYQGDTLKRINEVADNSIDLIVCDGPYGITDKKWDKVDSIQKYNLNLLKIFEPKLKEGAALYLFGKDNCLDFIDYRPVLNLKRKIIWFQPSRLAQGRYNYTNNYDIIAYFIKGKKAKTYNLDAIRIPQLVDAAQRARVEKVPSVANGTYNKTKFNPKGKNPGDVWGDIKQLTYKSKELISRDALNTIQKPELLIKRIILASSNEGDTVLDPFAGTGTCPSICVKYQRNFIAIERDKDYVSKIENRVKQI